MNDMQDWIEQNKEVLRLVLPQTQRQEKRVPAALNHQEFENELEDEDKYPMEGKTLVTRCVLSTQVKEDAVDQQHGMLFIYRSSPL